MDFDNELKMRMLVLARIRAYEENLNLPQSTYKSTDLRVKIISVVFIISVVIEVFTDIIVSETS